MLTTLAYATFDEILLAIVARLRDQLQLTEHDGKLTLDPDDRNTHLSGGIWITVSPVSGVFDEQNMDSGRATVKVDAGVRVRINTAQGADPTDQDVALLTDQALGVSKLMTGVLAALSLEWMPTRPNGDGMLRHPMRPQTFAFGKVDHVGYVEIPFSLCFDWDLGER